MTLVSFIVANYNYETYLSACIDSALASDWPKIEIIVIDDGSVDGSRAVIESYGSRITPIFQANSGQRVANNTGFAASKGDIIVFLDADDTVSPDFASAVVAAWGPTVSKVQVQMIHMDSDGLQYGAPFPAWRHLPSPAEIRQWVLTTSEYPTPPGSGNAYARSFLQRIFPISERHDISTDSTCLALAPLMGDVISIRSPLAHYRRHDKNDSALRGNAKLFAREVARAMQRQASAAIYTNATNVEAPKEDALRRSWYVLQLRIASMRLAPEGHPLPGDGRLTAIFDTMRNLLLPGSEPSKRRVKLTAWALATLLAPQKAASWLITKNFGS